MAKVSSKTQNQRTFFSNTNDIINLPNLVDHQNKSFQWFIEEGLGELLAEISPIEDYTGTKLSLSFKDYHFEDPKMSEAEARENNVSYEAPLKATVELTNKVTGEVKEQEIYLGDYPWMTNRGTFVINGAERVVVSQLHRSPGICFEESQHTSGKQLHAFRIIPDRGTWIEVQFDQNDLLWVYLDRRRRRRKFLVTTLLRAFGYKDDKDILSLFYASKEYTAESALKLEPEKLANLVYADHIVDVDTNTSKVIAKQYDKLSRETLKEIHKQLPKQKFSVFDTSFDDGAVILSLRKDISSVRNEEEALKEIFRKLRPGEPVNVKSARAHMQRLFSDPLRYDLGRVGRYKLNQKLNLKQEN